jgi:hypothetical protein
MAILSDAAALMVALPPGATMRLDMMGLLLA